VPVRVPVFVHELAPASGVCIGEKQSIDEAFIDQGRSSTGSIQVQNKT
jgi:hypothetical protein